ncbi:MAG: exo-alpha-sialidase [Bryobacterales bacterium]|nr:exo-alpha-sialidase [Bryobacterales bacterium]
MISRRGVVLGGLAWPGGVRGQSDLIAGIRHSVLWEGRKRGKVWFHPRACRAGKEPFLLMTLQEITGSDVFHHVHWSESRDLAASWSEPKPIPGMGRRKTADGLEEGVCDVVPEYHARTKTVLAMGHNVYYDKTGKLTRPDTERWPVYIVLDAAGQWGAVKKLEWDNPEASAIYTSNCSQRVTLENGDILVPLSFGPLGRRDRGVCTARCSFDGKELRIRKSGNVQRNAVKRGLLEPSLARFAGRYYMTIRAEDERGYVTVSADGLEWEEKKAWCWDDGAPLTMSTTQQRWLPHSEGLYLTYTRKDASNVNVVRWRTPIFAAEVDVERLCLIRSTERVVFRIDGDGVNHPETVPYLGNFHTTAISPRESIVTTCETLPKILKGNTIQARVHWAKVNRDVV